MEEQKITIDGIPLTYLYREALYDYRHLVVIFSGFGVSSHFAYYFTGKSFEVAPAHILWIKDDFYGGCCYYLCHKMDFSIEKAIVKFIEKFCVEHHLDISKDVTLVGASKGATAALYFCLKYPFKNAISSAPQIHIGKFVRKVYKNVAEHMMSSEKDTAVLDNIIYDLIEKMPVNDKNIYLISSPVDANDTCADIHEILKNKCNLVHVVTNSSCVIQHNEITEYNHSLILSFIFQSISGIHPKYEETLYNGITEDIFQKPVLQNQKIKKEITGKLQQAFMKEDTFFPKGVAYFRGFPSPSYGIFKKSLIFESINTKKRFIFPLDSTANKAFSMYEYKETFCDYLTIGFDSLKSEGISLSSIPCETYQLLVCVDGQGMCSETSLIMQCAEWQKFSKQQIYRIFNYDGKTLMSIISPISQYSPDIFRITKMWYKKEEKKIHYQGIFIRYGIQFTEWSDVIFFLVIKNDSYLRIHFYGEINIPELNTSFNEFGYYSKSNFCSMSAKGVDISDLPTGASYNVYITMLHKGSIISQCIDKIVLEENGDLHQNVSLAKG